MNSRKLSSNFAIFTVHGNSNHAWNAWMYAIWLEVSIDAAHMNCVFMVYAGYSCQALCQQLPGAFGGWREAVSLMGWCYFKPKSDLCASKILRICPISLVNTMKIKGIPRMLQMQQLKMLLTCSSHHPPIHFVILFSGPRTDNQKGILHELAWNKSVKC